METLGDSFLKLQLSLHAFTKNPLKNEGVLTAIRMDMENNGAFFVKGLALGLNRYILVEPISRSTYVPPHWPPISVSHIFEKVVSDVLEAIVGAAVEHGGEVAAAQTVKILLGGELEDNLNAYDTLWKPYAPVHPDKTAISQFQTTLNYIEDTFGYTFKNPVYLFQAFIHATYISEYDCYQRLEFLGDAVIGYLAMKALYVEDESYDCERLSHGRSLLVCNQFIGWLALALGLHKHLRHMNDRLGVALSKYIQKVEEQIASNLDTSRPWDEISSCPKVIADLFESLFGAIFLDSGMDFDLVDAIWKRIAFEPYWPLLKPSLAE
jgi:endoribonuclease Dicer